MSHGSSHYAFQPVTIMHGLKPTDAHAGEEEVRPILLLPTLRNGPGLVYGRSPPAAALFNNLLQADWAYFGLPRESTTFPIYPETELYQTREGAEQVYRALQSRKNLLDLLEVHRDYMTDGVLQGLHGSEACQLASQMLPAAAIEYDTGATDWHQKGEVEANMNEANSWRTLVEICEGHEVLLIDLGPGVWLLGELWPELEQVVREACCRLRGVVDLIHSLVGAPWSFERTRRVEQLQHLIRSALVARERLHAGGDDSDVSMADAD